MGFLRCKSHLSLYRINNWQSTETLKCGFGSMLWNLSFIQIVPKLLDWKMKQVWAIIGLSEFS